MAYTTIDKPTDYFDTNLVTGTTADQNITGMDFQPDWVWSKQRDAVGGHRLVDSVRGTGKSIFSNATDAEATENNISSFNSDGYTLVGAGVMNENTKTYAQWCWLAGGTASSNTQGDITSSVSANTTAGFSIVSWTGDGSDATIGHGLGAVPKMIIHKHRSGTVQWNVYHIGTGTGGYLRIDGTNAFSSNSGFFGTAPTSSVFSPGSHPYMSGSGNDNIAYCFADVKGFSKFGSYTGNGNADGTFVYTGFKPAFIMFKNASTTSTNWIMKDNKRSGTSALQNFGQMNPNQTENPSANLSNAENKASAFATDILSNGFKLRGTDTSINASGDTYIYMAFAESPFVTSTGIPITAR
jgi:hypothetical protein